LPHVYSRLRFDVEDLALWLALAPVPAHRVALLGFLGSVAALVVVLVLLFFFLVLVLLILLFVLLLRSILLGVLRPGLSSIGLLVCSLFLFSVCLLVLVYLVYLLNLIVFLCFFLILTITVRFTFSNLSLLVGARLSPSCLSLVARLLLVCFLFPIILLFLGVLSLASLLQDIVTPVL
jgi:hypothetical protein